MRRDGKAGSRGAGKPVIDGVFDQFIADQAGRIVPRTLEKYKNVLDLLRHHLNGYGHDALTSTERKVFEDHFNAEGEAHRDFCQIFGPEKILPNLSMFLSYFMVRKVIAGQDLLRAAGTVTKKLSRWLGEKGYVSVDVASEGAEKGAEAGRDLPRAERAARILYEAMQKSAVDPTELSEEDFLDFDHFTISKLRTGQLWLTNFEGGKEQALGPIAVPSKATELLQEGWDVGCALGRVRGKWRLVEVGNIYPG
ncbi:MAG TPA: hypothetical protein VI895_08490 [Bdellovibrionota bacterium]|nr:hypothetical protein [Bdellovibrionota bacterium]